MPKKNLAKFDSPHPAFTTGIVTFEFWNNNDESHRDRTLEKLAQDARKSLGVSTHPYAEPADLERGYIAFSGVAGNQTNAENLASKVMRFLDENAPCRVIDEHWIVEEIP